MAEEPLKGNPTLDLQALFLLERLFALSETKTAFSPDVMTLKGINKKPLVNRPPCAGFGTKMSQCTEPRWAQGPTGVRN